MNTYFDRPDQTIAWLEQLDLDEREIFERGYMTALSHVIEQLRDSKFKLLDKCMELEEVAAPQSKLVRLRAKHRVLDIYDEHFTRKLKALSEKHGCVLGDNTATL